MWTWCKGGKLKFRTAHTIVIATAAIVTAVIAMIAIRVLTVRAVAVINR